MRKLPLLALVLSALTTPLSAQADLLTALQAHENKDFAKAATEFQQLIPLASEQAAFNLGAMAFNGEGQPRDPVKALAYFEFAAKRHHSEAQALAEKLKASLSADEQQQAKVLLVKLEQQIKVERNISTTALQAQYDLERKALKRFPPEYPKEAAARGAFGSVMMRLLVNEQGDVEAVDVLNAFPKGLFEREAIRALKRWKYEPGERKFIGRVLLNFSIGEIDQRKIQRIFTEFNLWQYAALGSPMHQNALANVLELARNQSAQTQFVDKSLPPALGPFSADFVKQAKIITDDLILPPGFENDAFVTLDANGRVTEVHDNDEKRLATLSASLVGHQLTTDKIDAGFYKLFSQYRKKGPRLLTAQRIPQTYNEDYWLDLAARGGNLDAQRALASSRANWEFYLLEQGDPVVQSWAGTRLILDGKKAEGEKLLDAAIAKGHNTAKELKAIL